MLIPTIFIRALIQVFGAILFFLISSCNWFSRLLNNSSLLDTALEPIEAFRRDQLVMKPLELLKKPYSFLHQDDRCEFLEYPDGHYCSIVNRIKLLRGIEYDRPEASSQIIPFPVSFLCPICLEYSRCLSSSNSTSHP